MEFPLYCPGQTLGTSPARRIVGIETADVTAVVTHVVALCHAVPPLNKPVQAQVITARETGTACQSVTKRMPCTA
ncbi:MAG: hypothetical protein ACXVI5_08020 [Halobacteriota archaeon]